MAAMLFWDQKMQELLEEQRVLNEEVVQTYREKLQQRQRYDRYIAGIQGNIDAAVHRQLQLMLGGPVPLEPDDEDEDNLGPVDLMKHLMRTEAMERWYLPIVTEEAAETQDQYEAKLRDLRGRRARLRLTIRRWRRLQARALTIEELSLAAAAAAA